MDCPDSALHELELSALDLAAQCVKRAEAEMKEAVSHREMAGAIRFLINEREEMIRLAKLRADGKQGLLLFPEVAEYREARKRA